jgi:DNA-directed RNA polymerase specialized sigma24 family protein
MSLDKLLSNPDSFAWHFLRKCSKRLHRHPGFRKDDPEDIAQDLLHVATRRWVRLDPRLASDATFFARVVANAAVGLFRAALRQKRDFRCEGPSLNEVVPDGEGGFVELAQALDDSVRFAHTFQARRSDEDLRELRHDIAEAIKALPLPEAELAELLKEISPNEASGRPGWSRHKVEKGMEAILDKFTDDDLDGYL